MAGGDDNPVFTMPSLGADMDAGTLLEWLVKPGDTVHRGDPVAVVDTDKAAIEVESFHDGVVGELLVPEGTRVAVGTPLARFGAMAPDAGPSQAPAEAPAPAPAPARAPAPAPAERTVEEPWRTATPPVRHHAADLGVDLRNVHGTGAHGAITRADVDRAVGPPSVPAQPSPRETPTRRRAVTPYARRLATELGVDVDRVAPGRDRVRAQDVRAAAESPPRAVATAHPDQRGTIAALMTRSKREIPHYYVATTVDLHALTTWLRTVNRERPVATRIVPAAGILRAAALAARDVPELNGFWREDEFVPGDDVHLGIAVRVRQGPLVAPAIHHAADLDLASLMAALRDLVGRARAGRFTRAELADPTLTVTDLGDQGVEEVNGVIYPPQVALVGVGRVVDRPWAVDGMLAVRPVVRLSLSGDHRATDGATGARFLSRMDRLLQRPEDL